MTSKEALKEIECIYEHEESTQYPYDDPIGKKSDYKEEFDILRKLVERDTPMKVNKSVEWNYKCSNCKEYINRDYGENKYCGNCGQRLDWSD